MSDLATRVLWQSWRQVTNAFRQGVHVGLAKFGEEQAGEFICHQCLSAVSPCRTEDFVAGGWLPKV